MRLDCGFRCRFVGERRFETRFFGRIRAVGLSKLDTQGAVTNITEVFTTLSRFGRIYKPCFGFLKAASDTGHRKPHEA